MTDTLDELEKLLKLLVEAMPNWRVGHTGPFMTEAKGHSFHIFDDGDTLVLPTPGQPGPIAIVAGPAKAALIAAAISALPGLLESARRVERLEAELSGSARGSLVWWIERAKMQAQDMDDEGILVDRDHWQQIVFLAQTQIARAALKGT
jgi:hypothetical protein